MRISELSRRAGLPVSTIKFYIREGLLEPGRTSHPNQATYDEQHVERLRLINALREVAGLSLEVIRQVVDSLGVVGEEPGHPILHAMRSLYPPSSRSRQPEDEATFDALRAELRSLLRRQDWFTGDEAYLYLDELTDAALGFREHVNPEIDVVDLIDHLSEVTWLLAEVAYRGSEHFIPRPGDDLTVPVRRAIVGTVLLMPLVTTLLRSALANRSMHITDGVPPPAARYTRTV